MKENAGKSNPDPVPGPNGGSTDDLTKCPGPVVVAVARAYRDAVEELREFGGTSCRFALMNYDPGHGAVSGLRHVFFEGLNSGHEKDTAAQEIRRLIRIQGANCVAFVSDAWSAPSNCGGPPRNHPQRKEVIAIQIEIENIGRWGGARAYTRIGRQVFVENEMPTLDHHTEQPSEGRFVFFGRPTTQVASETEIFFPVSEILPDDQHDRMLAEGGTRRVAFVRDISARELAVVIRTVGFPVEVMHCRIQGDHVHGRVVSIERVEARRIGNQAVTVLVGNVSIRKPIPARQLADDLARHEGEGVVLQVGQDCYHLYSVVTNRGVTCITHGSEIDSDGEKPNPEH